jgi:UDP-2,4-diacetamido-2,4,6-trideoxy-beta-L-altropyranose hydrolase
MKIAIRTDASPVIGSGHVMRCLGLAGALSARGAQVVFVSRALPPNMQEAIAAAGHSLALLSLTAPQGEEAPQAAWPRSQQSLDAGATRAALDGLRPDWIVVDHYGLDHEWEREMRPAADRLMAIDDLGRLHECDLLLDANCHPEPQTRYAGSRACGTTLLTGPAFALLRPEFAQARSGVSVRSGPVRRLLVFMGGMDAGNATGQVLDALALLDEPLPPLDVVIGAGHPARAAVEAFCISRPGSRCHVQTRDMAALLAQCDLAIGAGGGATWERCCLGVPTLALALADNQRALLWAAARAGLVYSPDGAEPNAALLATHVQALLHNSALREALSRAGMAAVDGHGAKRAAAALFAAQIKVRPAVAQDRDRLLAWRNAPAVRASSRNSAEISPQDHERWWGQVLSSPDRFLLVAEDSEGGVGVVRFDVHDGEAAVSIYLAPSRLGQGLGPGVLNAGEAWLTGRRPDVSAFRAETLAGNAASRRLFEQGGYRLAAHHFVKRIGAT